MKAEELIQDVIDKMDEEVPLTKSPKRAFVDGWIHSLSALRDSLLVEPIDKETLTEDTIQDIITKKERKLTALNIIFPDGEKYSKQEHLLKQELRYWGDDRHRENNIVLLSLLRHLENINHFYERNEIVKTIAEAKYNFLMELNKYKG